MKIGIIGFGRLGKLVCQYLGQDFSLTVYDKYQTPQMEKEIKSLFASPCQLNEVCQSDLIIPFVPISEMENILREIAPKLKKGQVVADV